LFFGRSCDQGRACNIENLLIEGEITKPEHAARKAKIEAYRSETERRLKAAPADVKTLEDLLPKIEWIAAVIRGGDPEQQRAVLTALLERVEAMNAGWPR
jgi:hypothetical protein